MLLHGFRAFDLRPEISRRLCTIGLGRGASTGTSSAVGAGCLLVALMCMAGAGLSVGIWVGWLLTEGKRSTCSAAARSGNMAGTGLIDLSTSIAQSNGVG
jgi:hypothetical protein